MKNPLVDNQAIREALDAFAAVLDAEAKAGRSTIKRWSLFGLTEPNECVTASAGCMCPYCTALIAMSAVQKSGPEMASAFATALQPLISEDRKGLH